MLRTVDRLFLRELVPPFVFGVAAFTSLFFAGSYLGKLTNLLVQGVPPGVVGQLLLLYLPATIVLTLPMSVLLAVLLSFSRMSSDSEMVALWAGGVSLWRMMRPVLFLGVAVTLLSYGINEWGAPRASRLSTDLRDRALGEVSGAQKPFFISDLQEGRYNAVVFVNGGMDPKTRQLRDVTIFTGFTESGPQAYFRAKRAKWDEGSNWLLFDGVMQTFGGVGASRVSFHEWRTQPVSINRTPAEIVEEQRKSAELTFRQLAERIRRLKRLNQDTRELEVDLHNKIALPLASLVFALLAAPLGLRPHRGGSAVGFGLSIGLIFAYWMVWQYTSSLAKSGYLSPVAGSFLADALFGVVALALLVRAAR